jgi:phosphatidylserine/phosphatidylglycerophosphate/cardiolipin synthase-like enzyme
MRAGSGGRATYRSILDVFDELAGRGVELRILHAGPPSRAFRAALARSPRLGRSLALRACPRVHFKTVIVDGAFVYVGSANWTGAGLGAKGAGRRNFELGFAGSDDGLLDRAQEMLDRIWRGGACRGCKLREICPAPLDSGPPTRLKRPPLSKR